MHTCRHAHSLAAQVPQNAYVKGLASKNYWCQPKPLTKHWRNVQGRMNDAACHGMLRCTALECTVWLYVSPYIGDKPWGHTHLNGGREGCSAQWQARHVDYTPGKKRELSAPVNVH